MDNVHVLSFTDSTHSATSSFSVQQRSSLPQVDDFELLQQLQRSLDVDTLLSVYAQHIVPVIPFERLTLHSELGVNEVTLTDKANTNAEFELIVEDSYIGKLHYHFINPWPLSAHTDLAYFHKLLAYPLRNAIKYNRVLKLATRDPLTGLGNRSDFNTSLDKMLQGLRRQDREFSLMLLDLDNFKQVNDQLGHQVGDETLQTFAAILGRSVRGIDSVFRFGGDEFALLIDDSSNIASEVVAKRVLENVAQCELMTAYQVTTSIGFAKAHAQDNLMSLFERADKALYKAKSDGRNTYCGGIFGAATSL